jgi:hypothetical protein
MLFANTEQLRANAQEAMTDSDPRTATGWWSKITGGKVEKEAAVAQSDYLNQFEAEQAVLGRNFSSAEAAKARRFTERMSNTAYQRAAQDMRAAGINPAMMYARGGMSANTPSASAASAGSTPSGTKPTGIATSTGQLAMLMAAVVGTAVTAAGKISAAKQVSSGTKWAQHRMGLKI